MKSNANIVIRKDEDGQRINRALAERGIGTRNGIDAMIEKRQIRVNGILAKLGQRLAMDDTVTLAETKGKTDTAHSYFAYYKPAGVETVGAQKGQLEIKDVLLSGGNKLFPVGRLDKDSEGLIILTDDGRVTKRLLSPETGREKEYVVTLAKEYNADFLKRMASGVHIGGEKSDRARSALRTAYTTKVCTLRPINDKTFSITLTEGKNRQIRRMCQALGQQVVHLKRIRIIEITLGDLHPGKRREITGKILETFLRSLGL